MVNLKSKGYGLISYFINLMFRRPKSPFYLGILVKLSASECKIQDGYPVVTMDGDNGLIIKFYDKLWTVNKERWLDIKLDNKSYKHVNTKNLFVWFLYLPLTKRYFPLSHACYKYIAPKDEFVVLPFRITKRGYAMLDEDVKTKREYLAKIRKSRYGANLLTRIEQLNFKIIKN